MAVNSATSFVLSTILTLLIFSGMQMYKPVLVRSPITIILGGYLGSILFMFFVTIPQAIGNLEAAMFGKNYQLKLPEILFAFVLSLIASGMVHRICLTSCILFSFMSIYYMYKLSQKTYYAAAPSNPVPLKSRRHK